MAVQPETMQDKIRELKERVSACRGGNHAGAAVKVEGRKRILICGGSGCISSGSLKVAEDLRKELDSRGLDSQTHILVLTGCHGFCEQGPIVSVEPEETFYCQVTPDQVASFVTEHLQGGKPVESMLYHDPVSGRAYENWGDIPFYSRQVRRVLKNCGLIDPERIEDYLEHDGYQGFLRALTAMTPEEVIEEVKASGLRGRGGAGFPSGMKWQLCRQSPGDVKYLICNADEGDPGAFMDRSVLEGDPHAVIEGMLIAAYAIGASQGYVYVRAEYPLAVKRLGIAIAQAEEAGLLGDDILGSGFSFHLKIKVGAGAFVCGEETALMGSIEGNRGMPRVRPPFPAASGLWGKPTNINNVETYANVGQILLHGAAWYNSLGTEKSKGTKVFALTGKVNNTGLVEVPMGTTLREIIFEIGDGIPKGKAFKAVQIGGPSGGCLPASLLDSPVDYDSLLSAGAMMGSGGMVVMDESTCMVDIAKYFLQFTQRESCGKCTPCREGTLRMLEILERITAGEGREEDLTTLERLARVIKNTSLCGLGQSAPNPVLSIIRYFREELEVHIKEKKCPAGVCSALLTFVIEPEKCIGCGICAKNCPVGCINGERKQPHRIDPDKCIKCGACEVKCPVHAIYRA